MPATLVDTHCHLDLVDFDVDRDRVIFKASQLGIKRIVVPSVNLKSIPQIVKMFERYDQIFGAVGIHPNDIPQGRDIDAVIKTIAEAAKHPRIVAIGEIGLDYHWDKTPRETQILWLCRQLDIARDCNLPVILHNRKSTSDLLDIIKDWRNNLQGELRERPGVLHSISMPWDDARTAVDAGFMLGFTGPITYKNADQMRQVADLTPSDKMLVETDAPFLAPIPRRGARNEPAFLTYIVARLAEIRGCETSEICRTTSANACRLFGWNAGSV